MGFNVIRCRVEQDKKSSFMKGHFINGRLVFPESTNFPHQFSVHSPERVYFFFLIAYSTVDC